MLKLHLGCGDDFKHGFVNLDPIFNGWKFERGLADFADESVAAITISHALMYVGISAWGNVFREFYRVLRPGGVVRITEDDCETPSSKRHAHPWPDTRTCTGPRLLTACLSAAGFRVRRCASDESHFSDRSLLIAHREATPSYVFYIEGLKPETPAVRH